MCKLTLKHTPSKKQAPLTTRSNSLRCVTAADYHTREQYSKTGRTKPRKHLPRSNLSWNTCQDSLKIASLQTERRCFLKSHLGFKCQSTNIIMSSDSFSTVPPIVNAGDWGCIVRDLGTTIVLVLLAFNFIPQRSHHSLTLMKSRLRHSATVTLTPGDGTQLSIIGITDQRMLQNIKNLLGIQEEQ